MPSQDIRIDQEHRPQHLRHDRSTKHPTAESRTTKTLGYYSQQTKMPGLRQVQAFRDNAPINEREKMLKPYLPRESIMPKRPSSSSSNHGPRFHHRQRVRPAMRHIVHSLLFNLIHVIFSVYVRCRQIYHALLDRTFAVLYYHHRTPELIKRDVARLSRVPKHLSVILEVKDGRDGLEGVMGDACELAAWSASAGVRSLSIYERSGTKGHNLWCAGNMLITRQVS